MTTDSWLVILSLSSTGSDGKIGACSTDVLKVSRVGTFGDSASVLRGKKLQEKVKDIPKLMNGCLELPDEKKAQLYDLLQDFLNNNKTK